MLKEKLRHVPKLVWFFLGAFALVILDFATKWAVQLHCTPGVPVELIKNFLYIDLSYNTKIAFSIGVNGVGGRILNISISLVMSVGITVYWIKANKRLYPFVRVVLMLILAGAVGNLIDRAFYWQTTSGVDGVIDFVSFYLGGGPNAPRGFFNPFATFNFADAYLVVGVILLVVHEIVSGIRNRDISLERDPRLDAKPEEGKEESKAEENHEEDRPA